MEVATVVHIEEDNTFRTLYDTAAGRAAVVQRQMPPANAIVRTSLGDAGDSYSRQTPWLPSHIS